MMRKFIAIAIFTLLPAMLFAGRRDVNPQIELTDMSAVIEGYDLMIGLDIHASGVAINCNGQMTVEFALETPERRLALPVVVYTGKQRARYEERRKLLSGRYSAEPYYTYDRVKKRDIYRLSYKVSIPAQEWMEQAVLTYRMYRHDCSGDRLVERMVLPCNIVVANSSAQDAVSVTIQTSQTVQTVQTDQTIQIVQPIQSVVQPVQPEPQPIVPEPVEPEPVVQPALPDPAAHIVPDRPAPIEESLPENIRSVVLSLPITFPVSQTEILPNFGNNRRELARIDSLYDALLEPDRKIEIEHIYICGYASPEGGYLNNEWLAYSRSNSLKQYLCKQNHPLGELLDNATVDWIAEDWEGLARMVEQSYVSKKGAILDVIDNERLSPDEREDKLQQIVPWSSVYRVLLDDIYPRLRRIELTIYYTESEQ
jgi:outer membrane protein OmpA-like peptidoglycan-associated protein